MKPRKEVYANPRAAALLPPDAGDIRKRSVVIAGHRTSISVENAFWRALLEFAEARGVSANSLITEIDRNRKGNLSSAIRLFVLGETKKAANRSRADPA